MTISDVLDIVNRAGTVGLLILVVFGGWRRWYVWYWAYEDLEDDRNWWRQTAIDGLEAAEKTLSLHEQTRTRRAP